MDHIDRIIEQWARERPDLDTAPMALIGRIKRISSYLAHGMGETFAKHALNAASFDVLATLRRSGAPYALSPGDLMASTMVTSGTMTNRIDQLVKSDLVARIRNPEDGRSFLISLTDQGFELIERVVTEHVNTQKQLVAGLTKEQRQSLDLALRNFLAALEPD